MYKKDLALNDLWWSICHKTKPSRTEQNQTRPGTHTHIYIYIYI